ncbi:MAG: phosphoenolpyruvate carboxykinase (GTP), partial [Clostridiaceae bacterium]|nr:phosphoenolpyruvate carboxykinase (GTP) [Clostridiaceae bacterium]
LFFVNWFRKDHEGKWLWPGFGENSRVLKWIIERVSGTGKAQETPIGYMPTLDAIDRNGLDVTDEDMKELLEVNKEDWEKELASIREYYAGFGDSLPAELARQLEAVEARLQKM